MKSSNSLTCCASLLATLLALAPGAHAAQGSVVLLGPTQTTEYFGMYVKGFQKAAAEAGLKVDVKTSNFDANEQATQVDQTIAQRPTAMVLVPVDSSAMVPAIRRISLAKIPLVIGNSMPDAKYAKYWNAFTGPDDIGNGAQAARAIIQGFKEKGYGDTGKIIVINGPLGAPPQVQRYRGFEETLKKEAPGIEIVGSLPGDWDAVKAEAATTALLTQHKDVKGIYAQYDVMMQGTLSAIARMGMDPSHFVVVGHGCDVQGTTAIKAGKAYATIEQSPFDDGAYAAKAIAALLKGDKPESIQFLPHPIVTKANIGDCYSEHLDQ